MRLLRPILCYRPDLGAGNGNDIMNSSAYLPVSVEAIIPGEFPQIPVFMKRADNFVLYKSHEQPFNDSDRIRLETNRTYFLFVRQMDMDLVTPFVESRIAALSTADNLGSTARARFLYQTTINYLNEINEAPEKVADFGRCRLIAEVLVDFVAREREAWSAVEILAPHNYFLFVHNLQVAVLSLLMYKAEGITDRETLVSVAIGSLLHDIGMAFIPREIIDKPHSLMDIEYLKIKKHPMLGFDHLAATGNYDAVTLDIVKLHHERYDGSGYPSLMKKDEIPLCAQIASLCDVYSALITDRPYRKAASRQEALRMMKLDLRTGFNPKTLASFEKMILQQ